jgi:hypothetical protein
MAVPVAHEQIEQPRPQVRAPVDLLGRAFVQPFEELLRLQEAGDVLEPRRLPGILLLRIAFQGPEHPCELPAKGPQPRMIRQHHQAKARVPDPDRRKERLQHQTRRRKPRARLIAHDGVELPAAKLLGHRLRAVLVDGPELVLAPVRPLELERFRLATAALFLCGQPAREGVEVEDGHLDRLRPEVAIVAAEEDLREPARPILRSGHDA